MIENLGESNNFNIFLIIWFETSKVKENCACMKHVMVIP